MESRPHRFRFCPITSSSWRSERPLLQFGEYCMCSTVKPSSWAYDHLESQCLPLYHFSSVFRSCRPRSVLFSYSFVRPPLPTARALFNSPHVAGSPCRPIYLENFLFPVGFNGTLRDRGGFVPPTPTIPRGPRSSPPKAKRASRIIGSVSVKDSVRRRISTTNVQIRVVGIANTSLRILCRHIPPAVRSATVAWRPWRSHLRLRPRQATVACYYVSANFVLSLSNPPFTCRATRNTILPATFPR